MGEILVKTNSGWVPASQAYAKTSGGWQEASTVFAKASSGWRDASPFDTTAPSYPRLISLTANSARREITMVLRADDVEDQYEVMVKYSSSRYPDTAEDPYHLFPWSRKRVGPGQQVTYTWQPDYYDKLYYISAWCIDRSGNSSDRNRKTITIPKPTTAPPKPPTPPVPKVKRVYYNCDASGTWNRTNSFWSPSLGNQVGQAGGYNHRGGWFYGNKLSAALKNAKKIRTMRVRVIRSSSQHGVSGKANVWMIAHRRTSPGSRGNNGLTDSMVSNRIHMGTLGRGESKAFVVPSSWYTGFINGTYKGLGLGIQGGPTSYTSPEYMIAYGRGTVSGQVYVEWEE